MKKLVVAAAILALLATSTAWAAQLHRKPDHVRIYEIPSTTGESDETEGLVIVDARGLRCAVAEAGGVSCVPLSAVVQH